MKFFQHIHYIFLIIGFSCESMDVIHAMNSPEENLDLFNTMCIDSPIKTTSSHSDGFGNVNRVLCFGENSDKVMPTVAGNKRLTVKKVKNPEETKKRKLAADQVVNQSKKTDIRNILGDVSNEPVDIIGTPEALKIVRDFDFMKDYTPNGTKKNTAIYMANRLRAGTVDESANLIDQNNQLINLYGSGSKKAQILAGIASNFDSPMKDGLVAVKTGHILNPYFKSDSSGLLNINGGHSPEKYAQLNLFQGVHDIFIGQNDTAFGITVDRKVQKSMVHGMTEDSIVHDVKNGVTVAVDADSQKLKIRQIKGTDRYVGAYLDPLNPLVYATVFPLLTVVNKEKDSHGNIYVGKFSKLDTDGSFDHSDEHRVYISANQFNDMMERGKKFISKKNNIFVADITHELEECCKQELKELGMKNFPSLVYGIQDYHNNNAK